MISEKTKRFIKKNGLKLWIVVSIVAISGMLAFAAYTNQQNKAKKVIATSANNQMRFSSNYLDEGTTKVKTVVKTSTDLTVPVSIRNFSRTNPTMWYSSDINYTVRFELTDTTGTHDSSVIDALIGSDAVTVSYNNVPVTLDASNHSCSYSKTLAFQTDSSTVHSYDVVFPSVDTDICVRITATPTPMSAYPDLASISVILAISDASSVQTKKWDGSFSEKSSTIAPTVYDAYNYSLVGSGDSQNATFSWKPDKLEVNRQYFLKHFGVNVITEAVDEDGWRTVTIPLDTVASDGRYDFQLFKVYDPDNPVVFTSWSELEACVRFDDGL